ncbi:MAG: hypothetical protein ACYDHP_13215 [Ferrimicrobium sp.]
MTLIDRDMTLAMRMQCQRRRVIGFDVWAESPLGDERLVARARDGAIGTHLRLVAAVDEADVGVRLRFAARQDDVHVTDEAICELLSRLTSRLRWSELVKLEEFDGVPAFVSLPLL